MINSLLGLAQFMEQSGEWTRMLLDVAFKSAFLLLAAVAVNWLLRRAAAATRHLVWTLAFSGLLLLPALTWALPGWRTAWLPSLLPASQIEETVAETSVTTNEMTVAPLAIDLAAQAEAREPVVASEASTMSSWQFDWMQLALLVWLFGAIAVVLQLAWAMIQIRAVTRESEYLVDYGWTSLAKRLESELQLPGHVTLLRCPYITTPMTWGIVTPVVLLPEEADDWLPEWRRIVLLHELAHIKRRDCLTQTLAALGCAIYWFNPLVWLAARRLRDERERACDDRVLEVGTKASDYAGHLVAIAKSLGAGNPLAPVAVGMACSQLEHRVRAILDPNARRRGVNPLGAIMATLCAACLIVPLAMARSWKPAEKTAVEAAAVAIPVDVVVMTETASQPLPDSPENPKPAKEAKPSSQTEPESIPDEDEEQDDQTSSGAGQGSGSGQGTGQGSGSGQGTGQSAELTADQIIQMKVHNITPEFIEAMRKQGFENLSIRQLTELRVHAINEEFIKQARGWGDGKLTVRELVQLKVSGVTPEFINAMKQTGYDKLTINQLTGLKLHGVSPEYIATMRRLGYDDLTANKLTEMKIHGITEEFINATRAWTGSKPPVNELLQIKIHGITPEYATRMKALGFDDLSIRKLMQLKIHGVTEEYVKEMRGLGFDKLTPEQLLQMRIHGVDAEYVKKMRAAGLKNVSVQQMIEMKIHGIDSILLKSNR